MRLPRPAVDWRGVTTHPPAWLGRRGAILLCLGYVWVIVGIGVPTEPTHPDSSIIAYELIPVPVRIGMWITAGLLGIAGATIDRPRWEKWGYMALIFMAAERMLSFFLSWVVWLVVETTDLLGVTGDLDYGFGRGFIAASFWLAVTVMLYTASGWDEPSREVRVVVADATAEARRAEE